MSSERTKALDAAIREMLCPQLAERGFAYEASSRTFRREVGECTQVVNIQAGVRSMEGQFTVNLGVFHPMYRANAQNALPNAKPKEFDCWERERLAVLRDTGITRIFRALIRRPDNFLKWWLVTPIDKWWPFTANEKENARQLESVGALLLTRGIRWLDARSDVELLKVSYEKAKRAPTASMELRQPE